MPDIQLQQEFSTIRIPAYTPGSPERTQNTTGFSPFGADQMFFNCIPEVQGGSDGIAEKRPGVDVLGLDLSAIIPADGNTAKDHITIENTKDVNVAAIYNGTTSTIYIIAYNPSTLLSFLVGTITSSNAGDWCHLTELIIGGTPYLGVTWIQYDKTTSKGFYAPSTVGVFTAASLVEITAGVDADFPAVIAGKVLTGAFVQMNNTTYVMTTDGGIYNSDLNSITSWDALGTTAAQSYPDKGIGLARYKNNIVAFGEDSVEFFNDIGNPPPGSPLQRTEQSFIKFGCADPKMITCVNDQIYWIAASGSAATDGLWTLEGYTPKKLSTPRKDMEISSAFIIANNPPNMFLRSIVINGKTNILLTGVYNLDGLFSYYDVEPDDDDPQNNGRLVLHSAMIAYCLDTEAWWYIADMAAQYTDSLYWLPCGYQPNFGGPILNKYLQFIIKGTTDTASIHGSYIYSIEGTDVYLNFNDTSSVGKVLDGVNSNVVRGTVQFPSFDFKNLARKRIHRIELVQDMYSPAQADSKIYILMAKQDFSATPDEFLCRSIDVPAVSNRFFSNNWGTTRRFACSVTHCSNGPWRLRGLEITVTQGL